MEQEKNKSNKITKNKCNKKVFFIVCICCIILFVGLFIILKWNGETLVKYKKSNEERTQNGTKNAEYNYHIDLIKDDLYVDIMEKNYTNYSKLTEITYHNIKYYIEDGKLFKKMDDVVTEVDISGETAKFIASGWSGCSGDELMILTEEGNIYSINMDLKVDKIYDGGDAKEILYVVNEPQMFSTCSTFSRYALINEKLYRLPYTTDAKITERSISHPYSFIIEDGSVEGKRLEYLLYPDGSMNHYGYFHDMKSSNMPQIQNSFIKDETLTGDENKLISFVFQLDYNYYLIDTHGHLYKIIKPEKANDSGYVEISLASDSSLVNNQDIKSVDLYYNTKKNEKTNETISYTEQITFNLENGDKKVFSTDNNDKISYDVSYYFLKYYSNESN